MKPPRILAIAGSDSSGGAGIQADIKTITMLGGYAMTAVTALTAQNTAGVRAIAATTPAMLRDQIDACVEDIGIDAIKIGMLPDRAAVECVAEALGALPGPVVVDPVLVATSGDSLADSEVVEALHDCLFPLATIITPNLPELAALTGGPQGEAEAVIEAAKSLSERHSAHVLAKGGHGAGGRITDRLASPDGSYWSFDHPRIETSDTHGTGCTLSSALATFLGRGMELRDAVDAARQFVRLAIKDAPGFGQGSGPLGHHKVRLDFPALPSLNQVTLPARDYGEAVEFYRRLGLTLIVDSPTNGYARFECEGGATVSISTEHGEPGGASCYFEVANLETARQLAVSGGIELDEVASQGWNWHEAWGRDPSGNRFCLYQAREDRRHPPWRVGAE
ncbi:MAG: bifunctional hydroxymethylpyrimidine kinase/phosphomethylpyrimidine kinase [Alteripontixanthobacter sp.]